MSIPFGIFNLYQKRFAERFDYSRALLKKGFDFEKKESYQFNRKDALWARSADELNELWRMRVKNDWLRLKLAGKDDRASPKHWINAMTIPEQPVKIKSEDVFQYFMNAYSMAMTAYQLFGVRASEEFIFDEAISCCIGACFISG